MQEDIIHKEFRREIAMTYLKNYQNKPKSAARKPRVSAGVNSPRYDQLNHLVVPIPDGKNCKSAVPYQYQKCNFELCIVCFAPYHKIRSHKKYCFYPQKTF